MRRRLLLAGIVVLLTLGVAVGLPTYRASRDLMAVRDALGASLRTLDASDLIALRDRLADARRELDSLPVRAVAAVPGLGDNFDALRTVSSLGVDVLDGAIRLQQWRDERIDGLVDRGRVDLASLTSLEPPLEAEATSLRALEESAERARSGWLLPRLWDALDELAHRAGDLRSGTEAGLDALRIASALLGADEPRRYLVLSLNNAELRGAGGLLSAIGTLSIDRGRIHVGRQFAREQLVRRPYRPVPAPAEYLERYGAFKANTTLWANVSYSPDVEDVALVAQRLFRRVKKVSTDGAIVLDPRGLESLLPDDAEVPVPGPLDRTLEPEEIAPWIYSDAYAEFDDNFERRAAILSVGQEALRAALEGSVGPASIDRVAAAFAGGHLRFLSFLPAEEQVLNNLGITGAIDDVASDAVLIAAQNFGDGRGEGTKLDYWIDRTVSHACDIRPGEASRCAVDVSFENVVPDGLTRYVAGLPYGLLRSYVEVFVPRTGTIQGVLLNDEPVEYRQHVEEDLRSIGVYIEVPQSSRATVTVEYSLTVEDEGYAFTAIPQPLARDARLNLSLRVPRDWSADGLVEGRRGLFTYSGVFDRRVDVTAGPSGRTGIPWFWHTMPRLWGGWWWF